MYLIPEKMHHLISTMYIPLKMESGYAGGGYWEWKQNGFAFIKYEVCEYYWDEDGVDIQVSKEEYSRRLNAIYPEGAGKYPQNHYGLEEIYSILRN